MKEWLTLLFIMTLMGTGWMFQSQVPAMIQSLSQLTSIAIVSFCLLYCVASLLFLPLMPFILAAGALFGFYWGLILNLFCAILSASISFMISRYIGLDWLSKKRKQQLDVWLTRIEFCGWKSLALCRLAPFLPCAVVNYAYGFTRIKISVFILTSFIFFIPLKIIETYLGYLSVHY